jgi:hypothetical protein
LGTATRGPRDGRSGFRSKAGTGEKHEIWSLRISEKKEAIARKGALQSRRSREAKA